MKRTADFWRQLDRLVAQSELIIDRPRGSAHPSYPSYIYPLDYGYLEGTRSGDGEGIDVWLGSVSEKCVTAIVCSIDSEQRDAEIKILLGCTPQEAQEILHTHNRGAQAAILIERPTTIQQDHP